MNRNVIISEANKTEYRNTAYVERANARWEAWTYSEGRRYFLKLPTGCTKTGAISFLNGKKYDVVVVK